MDNLDLTKNVKFAQPFEGEEDMIFEVVNYNEETERVQIRLLNTDLPFAPIELVSINDIVNV